MNWRFHMPTQVSGGRGCVRSEFALMGGLGGKAMIVTGAASARACGALADMDFALSALGIPWTLFGQVEANPSIATIRTAARQAIKEEADFIIGIGGGSPLDAAKAIAVATANRVDDNQLFTGPWKRQPLPIVAVPTTAGTGSEVTQYAILTDDRIQSKRNLSHPAIFPRLAYLDPAYTDHLPRRITIHTAVDALSHALEGLVTNRSTPATDILAREAMGILGSELRNLFRQPGSIREAGGAESSVSDAERADIFPGTFEPPGPESRDRLMYASMLGGIVIANTGTTALHAMGYPLTYFKDIEHGCANGMLMPAYLSFVSGTHPERVKMALDAMGFPDVAALETVLAGLLGFREVLNEQEIAVFSGMTAKAPNLPNTLRLPSDADLSDMFRTLLQQPGL